MYKKGLLIIGLSAIFLWGVMLRSYGLGQQSYWIDEAYSITIAQAIVEHGYPLLDSGETIWRAPLYHYALACIVGVFGKGPIATRTLSVIIGSLTVLVFSYIARTWYGDRTGMIVLLLASFSYWEIAWSRQARMYMLLQLLFWVTIFLFERWQKNKLHWLWFVLTGGATIATHKFGWLIIFALTMAWLIQEYIKKPNRRIPLIVPYLSGIIGIVVLAAGLMFYSTGIGPVQYWTHYISFIVTNNLELAILATVGLFISMYRNKIGLALWLAAIFLGGLGVLSYGVPLLQYRYLFFLLPALLFLGGYTLHCIKPFNLFGPIAVVLIVLSSSSFLIMPQAYFALESDALQSNSYYKSFTPQPDFSGAYEYINEKNPEILITPYPSISRLYRDIDDTAAIYVDLTGTISEQPKREIYSGVNFTSISELKALRESGHSGLIVLDYLAEHRMPADLNIYIDSELEAVYSSESGPWSRLTIYKL